MSVQPEYQNTRKILIAGTSWLGDTVLSIPTINGVRSLFPAAHIAILVKDSIADLFRAVPAIDEIIPFRKKSGLKKIAAVFYAAHAVKKKAFDLAIIFPRSLGSALVCFLARIPKRIGFFAGLRGILLTEVLKRGQDICSVHQVHYYKTLLSPIGNAQFPDLPCLSLPDAAREWAHTFLLSQRNARHAFTVGLNPGSTYGEAKQWLPEKFTELSRRLNSEHDSKIVIFGDAYAGHLAAGINAGLDHKAVDATGRTDVLQLAALLERCDVLVTNDTGPMHVACAVGTPVVAVFGSTDPLTTSPLGPDSVIVSNDVPCSPCLKRKCPEEHHRCMRSLSVDDVAAAVLEQLQKRKQDRNLTG